MRKVKEIIPLLVLIFMILGCSKDDMGKEVLQTPLAILSAISPMEGPKTTIVTVNGNNFGTDLSKVQVYFNGTEATIVSVENTKIVTKVPAKAYTGNIKVIVNDIELDGPEFNYTITDIMVETYAGSVMGDANGTVSNARFNTPSDGVFDSQGNLFIVDYSNHKIRKISPEGVVSTFAGSSQGYADGVGTNAQFNYPINVAIDDGDNLYISDSFNYRIRKITPSGVVSTLAGSTHGNQDGIGANAQFGYPSGLTLDDDGYLYVADSGNHAVRKITPEGLVTTYAGSVQGNENGNLSTAKFNYPSSIIFDAEGNLLVADSDNHQIKNISPSGVVSTYAGSMAGFEDGNVLRSKFNFPSDVKIDLDGTMYVADFNNFSIRKITPNDEVLTLAGDGTVGANDGIGANATFNRAYALIIGKDHTIYVIDTSNHRIRKISQE